MKRDNINWPAFIKYSGDDELVLVKDDTRWQREFRQATFDADDFLVDSGGRRFTLAGENSAPVSLAQPLADGELDTLLRNHFAALGECCIAKIPALPPAEALRLLCDTEDS
ncbi:MAG: DUF4144 family protein [Gammaproteobacteria bacterium]|nr:DUF4144 family protein [Gammaproteobacteria bacterium]